MSLIKLLFPILIFSFQDLALGCSALIWSIEGQKHEICYDPKLDAMLSKSCFNKPCGARKFLLKAEKVKLDRSHENPSNNPGSIYCRWLKGKVLMGRNDRNSETTFCQASDESLVDLTSLGPN